MRGCSGRSRVCATAVSGCPMPTTVRTRCPAGTPSRRLTASGPSPLSQARPAPLPDQPEGVLRQQQDRPVHDGRRRLGGTHRALPPPEAGSQAGQRAGVDRLRRQPQRRGHPQAQRAPPAAPGLAPPIHPATRCRACSCVSRPAYSGRAASLFGSPGTGQHPGERALPRRSPAAAAPARAIWMRPSTMGVMVPCCVTCSSSTWRRSGPSERRHHHLRLAQHAVPHGLVGRRVCRGHGIRCAGHYLTFRDGWRYQEAIEAIRAGAGWRTLPQ